MAFDNEEQALEHLMFFITAYFDSHSETETQVAQSCRFSGSIKRISIQKNMTQLPDLVE
jgi:starvation-inducible outer membrane lipoprotein